MAQTKSSSGKRRTTLALPVDALRTAERIARERHINLGAVVGEAMASGLQIQVLTARSRKALERYRTAFHGFSKDELSILDGVMLERGGPAKPRFNRSGTLA